MLFDIGILPSKKFDFPVIGVGNLSVGGTGKTPMVNYIIDLLKDDKMVGVVSRGYKRETSGFVLANYHTRYPEIGDEPMLFFERYRNRILLAVCESRVEGIKKLKKRLNPDVFVLDDSYQHRRVKPGFNVLIMDYNRPYYKDFLLPAGRLRESILFTNRAHAIVVTKCPADLEQTKKEKIAKRLTKNTERVFFSSVYYHPEIISKNFSIPSIEAKNYYALVVCGIANPKPFLEHSEQMFKDIIPMVYPDHHNYSVQDVENILQKFETIAEPKLIITTEKDYVKLKLHHSLDEFLFYQKIDYQIDREKDFQQAIRNYVNSYSTNR